MLFRSYGARGSRVGGWDREKEKKRKRKKKEKKETLRKKGKIVNLYKGQIKT